MDTVQGCITVLICFNHVYISLESLCLPDPISMSIKNTLVQVKNDLVCTDYIVDVVNSSNIFPKDRRS